MERGQVGRVDGLTGEEITRCKDCEHYREVRYADGTRHDRCSGVFAFVKCNPYGFCAWAKRRKDA